MDGFDHVDDGLGLLVKWDYISYSSRFYYGESTGRTGGWGLKISESEYMYKNITGSPSAIIVGVAAKFPYASDTRYPIVLLDGNTAQISLKCATDGSIKAYRGTSTLLGSSDVGIYSATQWNYIELKVLFSATVGTVEVRLNGSTVLNLTGQNTISSANTYATKLQLNSIWTYTFFDDVYICDTTGTENNDFLGDVQVITLYPTSDGTHTDFTPSTGTDHYALVDEPQLIDTTDYNSSTTVGHKETYNMSTFSGSGTIHGIQVTPVVNNINAGAMITRAIARSGGTPADNEGVSRSLSQTVKAQTGIFEKEPTDDAAWTAASINAAEFGIKVQS